MSDNRLGAVWEFSHSGAFFIALTVSAFGGVLLKQGEDVFRYVN